MTILVRNGVADDDDLDVVLCILCVLYILKFKFDALKSRGLTVALAFQNVSRAKAAMKPSLWPGLAWPIWARLGSAHGLRPGHAQHYW